MRVTLALFIAAILILLLAQCQPCSASVDRSGWFIATITHYSRSADQGTEDGITASGVLVFEGCAASYPRVYEFGTKLFIAGYGIVEVWDTGTGFKNKREWLDIYVPDEDKCFERGVVKRDVCIIEE